MNNESIKFLQENHQGQLAELGSKFYSINGTLQDILSDLATQSQSLQKKKRYDKVLNVVGVQKEINELMDENNNLIKVLQVSKDKRKEKNHKISQKRNPAHYTSHDEYSVNTEEPHDLEEDLRFKRPHAFSIGKHYDEAFTWKEMLVRTCEYLYKSNPEKFKSFAKSESMQWGDTFNFSKDKKLIREPYIIGDSGVYVEIAKGSIGVRQLIIKMLEEYKIDTSDYKIYLRADYSSKRENDDSYRRRQS